MTGEKVRKMIWTEVIWKAVVGVMDNVRESFLVPIDLTELAIDSRDNQRNIKFLESNSEGTWTILRGLTGIKPAFLT